MKSKRKDASPKQNTAGNVQSRKQTYYRQELLQGLRQFLPRRGLPLRVPGNSKTCWTPRLIVICAILMVWSSAQTLKDRFADGRLATIAMYNSRRRPGKTAEGFIAVLCKHSAALLRLVCQSLRPAVQDIAGSYWTLEGWLVFAADGSRVECPMTRANEKAFGCAGKGKTTPQQFLTVLLHLGTGLPWAWIRGHSRSSERRHLGRMVKLSSDSPRQARVELDWSVVALWILGLMTVSRLIASGRDPAGCSPGHALRVVREAMRNIQRRCRRGSLAVRLRQAVRDRYRRTSGKKARHWPHKKTQTPPGIPKMRMASREERSAAHTFQPLQAAA